MTSERAHKIRKICGIILSISMVLSGILLIVACIGIYKIGDQPFSRESVADAFSNISIPVIFCLGMIILNWVVNFLLPPATNTLKAEKSDRMQLQRLRIKADLSGCDEQLRKSVAELRQTRRRRTAITHGLLGAGAVAFLIYVLSGDRFHQSQITDSMIRAMAVLLPCLLPGFVCAIIAEHKNRSTIAREIQLLKTAPSAKKQAAEPTCRIHYIKAAVLICAIGLLVFGFATGGTADVLTKAINICTECVGLG